MSASATPAAPSTALGTVRVRGADVLRYLQGQLSQNVERVTAECSLPAGLHNAQGRVIAILRLIHLAPDDMIAVLPRELARPVVAALSRFVLRAKVSVTDDSDEWQLERVIDDGRRASWPRERNAQLVAGDTRIVCVGGAPDRWLRLAPRRGSGANGSPAEDLQRWEECEIAAGEPQVYAATTEAFVSQMLNLDLLDAIAFDKGCYTGQEIIARAHYRGRMKRRMQRFTVRDAALLAPGSRGRLPDGRSFTVVRAVASGSRVDFLAVTSLPIAKASPIGASGSAAEGPVIDAAQQPLPYDFPP